MPKNKEKLPYIQSGYEHKMKSEEGTPTANPAGLPYYGLLVVAGSWVSLP